LKRLRIGKLTALLAIVTVAASTSALGVTKRAVPSTRLKARHHRVRRINWNPLIRGSHESLLRQNEEIDRLGLPRIEDVGQLEELKSTQQLVPLEDTKTFQVSPTLDPEYRYAKPWTRDFIADLSQAYYDKFHAPLVVTSAVRTVEYQRKLRRRNKNAAPDSGETASSHLAGLSIDIAKRGMTRAQHKWFENYLADMRDQNLVEAAEERRQACFHIMVSERYAEWRDRQALATEAPVENDEQK
jgi:hypothetical protein